MSFLKKEQFDTMSGDKIIEYLPESRWTVYQKYPIGHYFDGLCTNYDNIAQY